MRRALARVPGATVVDVVSTGVGQWLVSSDDRDVGGLVSRALDGFGPDAFDLCVASPAMGGTATVLVTAR